MNFIRIDSVQHPSFADAWHIYEESFSKDKRRDIPAQKELFLSKDYHFLAIRDLEHIVAVLAYWTFPDFVFIEHFAVASEKRGSGFGEKIFRAFFASAGKRIILETELPETEEARRRIKFYKSLGLSLNSYTYFQPSYKD